MVSKEDREASVFAVYLLMPESLFTPIMETGLDLLDDDAVGKVARKFRVPVGAVHFRAHLHRQRLPCLPKG